MSKSLFENPFVIMGAMFFMMQASKHMLIAVIVLMLMLIPGLKDKALMYIRNGYDGISRVSNQGTAPGDAKDSTPPGGP